MAVNKKILAGVLITLMAAAVGSYKYLRPVESGITATGTIEVTRADVMPKVSGYLTGLQLQVGDNVQAQQTVAKIARDDLTAQVIRDEAALAKASAQLRDLEAGSRSQELQELRAMVDSSQSVYEKAKQDYQRYQNLYAAGAISAQQLDAARSSMEVAYSSMTAASQRLSLGNEGNRPEAVEAQRQEVRLSAVRLY